MEMLILTENIFLGRSFLKLKRDGSEIKETEKTLPKEKRYYNMSIFSVELLGI